MMRKIVVLLAIVVLCFYSVYGQDQQSDLDLITVYDDYTEMERELVFAHLNKSIYIKGESIGIKAYIIDKYSKQLAIQAGNLYCTIADENGSIVESKLLMVENGTATGDFSITEKYTSGHYTIKLYTNWMRNFNEDNLYAETIRVIDPSIEQKLVQQSKSDELDAQFLPEGGHLLADVENVLGIVIKNDKGLGVPDIEGNIVNESDEVVTNFKVNQFGIGKCLLTPKKGSTYKAKFKYGEQEFKVDIKDIDSNGVTLNLSPLRDKVALTIRTNTETLPTINKTYFKLVIHNGNALKEITFKFNDEIEVIKVISNQDLFSGLNIFTLFDANNNPLLERLYFNYEGVHLLQSGNVSASIANDTIAVSLPYNNEITNSANTLSVSVLPIRTNSFHHQNIVSQFFLQNYLKGYVEKAHYYFQEITPKKTFELDMLLITQGWSSYDWNTIFNNPPDYDFDYESGISYTINSSDDFDKQLMIFPTLNHPMKLVTLTKDDNSYTASGLFPINNEEVRIRQINANGKITKPDLYIQFDPIKIPEISMGLKPLIIDSANRQLQQIDMSIAASFNQIERLDEVLITKKKDYTKIEKLNNRSVGTVEEMDADMVRRYRTLDRYLRDKGFFVQNSNNNNLGDFVILNNTINSFRDRFVENEYLAGKGLSPEIGQEASSIPIVYLDDVILGQNLNMLQNMSLEDIEWIEVNKSGVGGGLRAGGAGLIRIKTRPTFRNDNNTENVYASYEIPLKFNVPKTFYVPEYTAYDSDFFKEFGVIDWFPNMKLDDKGQLNLKITNNQIREFKVFVEGMVDDAFVSEVKTITLN